VASGFRPLITAASESVMLALVTHSMLDWTLSFAPKPFESWVLNNETADWESPVGPAPELTEAEVAAGSRYQWDEENGEWDLVTPEAPAAE
jgi:hypothetical protein